VEKTVPAHAPRAKKIQQRPCGADTTNDAQQQQILFLRIIKQHNNKHLNKNS